MGLRWEQVVIAASDRAALGRWWCDALGWVVVDDASAVFEIQSQPDRFPGILFLSVDDAKKTKNRLHIDLRMVEHSCVSRDHRHRNLTRKQ
ncbi:MAG: VOC family protein [Acidimicrobiales bacterium]